MSSEIALPWILAASTIVGLGAALLLRAWANSTAREIAEEDLHALEAGADLLRRLEPIVAQGEALLQTAAIRSVSPELVQAVADFRHRADAALQQVEAGPWPYEALSQLGLDAHELVRAAGLAVSAVNRLHDGAANYEPNELMHGEARFASAQLSELAAKMSDARALIEADRSTLLPLMKRGPRGFSPPIDWRPQASK